MAAARLLTEKLSPTGMFCHRGIAAFATTCWIFAGPAIGTAIARRLTSASQFQCMRTSGEQRTWTFAISFGAWRPLAAAGPMNLPVSINVPGQPTAPTFLRGTKTMRTMPRCPEGNRVVDANPAALFVPADALAPTAATTGIAGRRWCLSDRIQPQRLVGLCFRILRFRNARARYSRRRNEPPCGIARARLPSRHPAKTSGWI